MRDIYVHLNFEYVAGRLGFLIKFITMFQIVSFVEGDLLNTIVILVVVVTIQVCQKITLMELTPTVLKASVSMHYGLFSRFRINYQEEKKSMPLLKCFQTVQALIDRRSR